VVMARSCSGRAQHQELLAAPAGRHAHPRVLHRQASGHGDEHLVPAVMPHPVVDPLEVIEIEQDQRRALRLSPSVM